MDSFDENSFRNNIKFCLEENNELPYQFDEWFQNMIFSGEVFLSDEKVREFYDSQQEDIVLYAMEFGKGMENIIQEANYFNMNQDVAQALVDWTVAKYIKNGVIKIGAEISAYENDHDQELVSEYGSVGQAFNHIYNNHIINTPVMADEMLDMIIDKTIESKNNYNNK